jgi:hypothetical protein
VPKRWAIAAADGGERQLHPQVMERLERELGVINTLGFASYFLIVWDFVRYAREVDLPAAARGSGVGALVSLLKRARTYGGEVRVRGLRDQDPQVALLAAALLLRQSIAEVPPALSTAIPDGVMQ